MATPKVSIVTPSFNQARFLPQTLHSVREQDYPNIEHIVVDGGSTDGTLEILRATPQIRWVSEPDRGQAHALNKGFALASGEILAWLNSDDTMDRNAVSTAVAAMQRTGADMVYGDLEIVGEHGEILRDFYGVAFDLRILLYGINFVGQQSVFFRRELLSRTGPLREDFDNAFDYELWLRFALHGKCVYVPGLRAQIRKHATAKSIARDRVTHRDIARIRAEYWARGGLPRFLRCRPFFWSVNYSYRLKRWLRIRKAPGKPRILMFGYLPPPHFGPATAYESLMRSGFARRFAVTFVDLTLARTVDELQTFTWRKLGRLFKVLAVELSHLLTRRFDYCCYPVAFNRNAFLKDALLLLLARMFGVQTVVWAHGNNLPDFRAGSPRWLQWIIDRTCGRARAAIVLGERLRFNFEKHLPAERIFVAPYGIETPPQPAPTVRKSREVCVLYLGNLIAEKGVHVLLQAIPKIVSARPDVRFRFAGAWWRQDDRKKAEDIIRDAGIGPYVEFKGVVAGDAKWQLLAESDILAFPTFYYFETFGLVLLEALWAGLAVVTTRRVAIPEIIQDGVNGLFVNEQDADDLAEKLLRLVNDASLRQRMYNANRQRFQQHYTHEHFGARMITVFEALTAANTQCRHKSSGQARRAAGNASTTR